MCELSPVPFHNDTIFCITIENQPYTPVKPIIINMGLDWGAQSTKLRANRERWGIVIIAIPSESGEQETTCIPVRKLPAFLASINPKKVKPELRERIELYQAECDDALWNYWMNGRAERAALAPSNSADAPITPDQQCTLQALLFGQHPKNLLDISFIPCISKSVSFRRAFLLPKMGDFLFEPFRV